MSALRAHNDPQDKDTFGFKSCFFSNMNLRNVSFSYLTILENPIKNLKYIA